MPEQNKDPHQRPRQAAGDDEKQQERRSAPGRGAADQLGTILNRGLDLAEASLSLGLKVINRAGAAAAQAAADTVHAAEDHGPAETAPPDGDRGPEGQVEQSFVTNRLPLIPGAPIQVSFSINNDSMDTAKKVSLRIGELIGETTGAVIAAAELAVKPTRKTIAPMDFDKFVLQGAVPADAPPDAYQGQILVASGEEFAIPVRLIVMGD